MKFGRECWAIVSPPSADASDRTVEWPSSSEVVPALSDLRNSRRLCIRINLSLLTELLLNGDEAYILQGNRGFDFLEEPDQLFT